MRDAIMIALNREAQDADGKPTRKLNLIAEKLVDLAIEGDMQAIKEIADRTDGKAVQTLAGDESAPLHYVAVMPPRCQSAEEWLQTYGHLKQHSNEKD